MTIATMRRFLLHLPTMVIAFAGAYAQAQQVFLESFWQNNVASPTAAIWSGGNESSTNDAPRSLNGILLVESAIGQLTAETLAYPQAPADLSTLANTANDT